MSPNCSLLVFLGLCGIIHTQDSAQFLLPPPGHPCLLQPPLPHSSSPRGLLGGGGAGRKRVHQKSCSVRARSFKALASSKDRNWRLAYTRFTCAQQSLEVEPTKTGLELHMVVSTLGLSSPFSRPAQGLQALSHWTATPSCSSPLQFSKHAFLRWRPVCVIFMWGNGWITTEQHPEFPTALG